MGLAYVPILEPMLFWGFGIRPPKLRRFWIPTRLCKPTTKKAAAHRTLHLKPYKSSGLWDGKNPFTPASQQPPSADQAVAILTRASLRWNRLAAFWKAVPAASKALSNAQGVQFYKGIGEWPWIQQATVSIWNQAEAVHQFAYKGPHAKIVKKTRQQQWYAEDLFARFVLLSDTQKIKHS